MLREAARFALGKVSWSIAPKITEVVDRIRAAANRELGDLEESQREKALAYLHDEFTSRIVAKGAA